jgi:hypothetical protein
MLIKHPWLDAKERKQHNPHTLATADRLTCSAPHSSSCTKVAPHACCCLHHIRPSAAQLTRQAAQENWLQPCAPRCPNPKNTVCPTLTSNCSSNLLLCMICANHLRSEQAAARANPAHANPARPEAAPFPIISHPASQTLSNRAISNQQP